MQKDTKNRLSHITISLHWVIALTIIAMIAIGLYMSETESYSLYPIHKSIGVSIFIIIMIRVVWRIYNGWPEPASNYKKWEQTLSKIVHYVLITGTVLIPISGMVMSAMGGHGISVFGFELIARNPNPLNPEKVIPINETLAGIGHETHEIVSYIMIVAITLHFAGALKHHVIDGDGTLRRMLGKKI